MATTTERLRFEADASQAKEELDSLGQSARQLRGNATAGVERLDRSLKGLEDQADETTVSLRTTKDAGAAMGTSMASAAMLVTGVNSAFALGQRAVGAFTGSMEQFLRQTKDGDVLWEQLERRLRGVRGGLAAMLLGTNDAAEGYEDLDQIAWMVQSTMQALTEEIGLNRGQLVNTVRNGIVGAVEGYSLLRTGVYNLEQTMGIAAIGVRTAALGWELFGGVILNLRAVIAEFTTDVLGGLVDGLSNLVGGAASVAEHLGRRRMGASLRSMQADMEGAAASVRGMDDDLQELNEERLAESARAMERWGEEVEAITDGMLEAEAAHKAQRDALDELVASLDGAPPPIDEVTRSTRAQTEAMTEAAEATRTWGERFREAAAVIREFAEAKTLGEQLQGKTISAMAMEEEARVLDVLTAKREEAAAAAAAEDEARRERMRDAASTFSPLRDAAEEVTSAIISGQELQTGAVIKGLGEQLVGAGVKGLGEAAIMAFTPGLQAAATAKGLASAAAVATGALMAATGKAPAAASGGGAVAAGAAPPSQAQVVQRTSNTTSVVLNYATLASTRESQIAVAGAVRGAVANGYA